MRFRTAVLLALISAAGLVGCSGKPHPTVQDTAKDLNGEWEAVSVVEHGRHMDKSQVRYAKVKIDDGKYHRVDENPAKFISHGMCSLRADGSKSPAQLEIIHLDGDHLGKTRSGIYALEGDKLKICLSPYNLPAPTDFTPNDRVTLLVLERKK